MLKYVLKRLLAAAVTLFIILALAFAVVRLMPGSVYDDPNLDQAIIDMLIERAHLDKPIHIQFYYFLKGVVMDKDWGTSVKVEPGVPAFQVLANRIPVSLQINLISLLISVPIGIVAGIVAALQKNRGADTLISVGVIIFISVPSFVFASLMQYFLAYKLKLFPILYQPSAVGALRLKSMVLPIAALSLSPIATITRYLRGELIEVLGSEYMLLAKTKGLGRFKATVKHAFRNASLPMMNVIVPMFANIVGGSMVIERLFSIPGVGGTMIKSINANDHSLTVATLMFYAMISIGTALLVDLSYGLVDPRVRVGGKKDE
ncbi:MAG: ABC transporter permease [Firmicutes bacterium]|jgi:oligopeptide transport system permease protein|nr:ABC transporter permease [Bacillota bacterium]